MERLLELLRAEGWAASVNPDCGLDHGAWVPIADGDRNFRRCAAGYCLQRNPLLAAATASGLRFLTLITGYTLSRWSSGSDVA